MKIVIKRQVEFSDEEGEILKSVDEKLKEFSCAGMVNCNDCPFFIKTKEDLYFKCVINILHNIYTTYILSNDDE